MTSMSPLLFVGRGGTNDTSACLSVRSTLIGKLRFDNQLIG